MLECMASIDKGVVANNSNSNEQLWSLKGMLQAFAEHTDQEGEVHCWQ